MVLWTLGHDKLYGVR